MKSLLKIKPFCTWICLFAYLFLGTFSFTQGMVLCVEADGRISLETGINGICSDFYEQSLEQLPLCAQNATQALEKSKNCTDIQLSTDNISQCVSSQIMAFPTLDIPVPPVNLADSPVILLPLTSSNQFSHPPPPLRPAHHTFLKTIKLLV